MRIQIDNLTHPKVAQLLQAHLDDIYATSPAKSVYVLDLENYANPTSPSEQLGSIKFAGMFNFKNLID